MAMVAFEYRDFWEVPRLLVCTVDGTEILLDSEFDEARQEYASHYNVYALPPEARLDAEPSPENEPAAKVRSLGRIPVSAIEFDPSKKLELEAGPLLALLGR